MWFATDDIQNIILNEEKCFRKGTMLLQKHLVEFQLICQHTIKDATVQLKICGISKLRTNKHVEKDVFSSIINFYVWICWFTYANSMVQKFKLNQKWTGKDKLLWKIIKQSCDENINDPCDQKSDLKEFRRLINIVNLKFLVSTSVTINFKNVLLIFTFKSKAAIN